MWSARSFPRALLRAHRGEVRDALPGVRDRVVALDVLHGRADLEKHGNRYILTLCRLCKTLCETTQRRRAEGTLNSQNVNSQNQQISFNYLLI